MAEDKGSDLDVFEGLAKKKSSPPSKAVPAPPGTLRGGLVPPSGAGSAPPAPPGVAEPADDDEGEDIHSTRPTPLVPEPMPEIEDEETPASSKSGAEPSEAALDEEDDDEASGQSDEAAADSLDAQVDSTDFVSIDDAESVDAAEDGSVLPGSASTDFDWDDEEEATQVFSKASHGLFGEISGKNYVTESEDPDDTAKRDVAKVAALLASSGGSAAPVQLRSVPPMEVTPTPHDPEIPGPAPLPAEVRGAAEAEPAAAGNQASWAPSMVPPEGGSNNKALFIIAALVGLVAVYFFMNRGPGEGSLEINVSHQGKAVTEAAIYVDGQKKCEFSPCKLDKLSPGKKNIRVKYGLLAGMGDVEVKAGEAATLTVAVGESKAPDAAKVAASAAPETKTEPASPGKASVKLSSKQSGVKVSINGADKGGLPLTLSDLEPGKVKLRFDGGEHYEVLEKEVELEAGKTLELTELELKMTSAEVTFVLKSKGAKVKLVAADGKSRILDLSKGPAKEKLAADKKWQIAATLNGYLPYKKDVAISDKPEFEFEIALEVDRNAKAEESTVAEAKTTTTKPEPKKEAPKAKPASDSGYGTINANSIPPSRVIIAGRPRGTTPVTGVRVKAGRHTVIFIHKKYGRKARSLTVAGGQSKTAVVRFKKPKK